jgi:lipopolysaccharide transport system ATP-binding protein
VGGGSQPPRRVTTDTVICVENLSKVYRIGASGGRPEGLRHVLDAGLRRWARLLLRRPGPNPKFEDFWALKDVSFEVKRGDCVGVIGRNGAGKSTLLKILSRITDPTEGEARLRGRVGSLLEVGTGFHPELTGRENIFLNGAVLGMGRKEIGRKYDEIVAFAEVEQFLDTPVKYYSSGMYTRLAFAVAAHLEPEILIVDEVLAVGDTQFQQKCLGKLSEVARGGRTVLFVSHNLGKVAELCNRGVYLRQGRVAFDGTAREAVREYLVGAATNASQRRFCGILRDVQVTLASNRHDGHEIELELQLDIPAAYEVGIDLVIRQDMVPVLFCGSAYFSRIRMPAGPTRIGCTIGPVRLATGRYEIDVKICKPMERWVEEHDTAGSFDIDSTGGTTRPLTLQAERSLGYVIPAQHWSVCEHAGRLGDS